MQALAGKVSSASGSVPWRRPSPPHADPPSAVVTRPSWGQVLRAEIVHAPEAGDIVTAHLPRRRGEALALAELDEPLERREKIASSVHDQIVALAHDRNEVEPELMGDAGQAETGVGRSARHLGRQVDLAAGQRVDEIEVLQGETLSLPNIRSEPRNDVDRRGMGGDCDMNQPSPIMAQGDERMQEIESRNTGCTIFRCVEAR